MPNDLEYYKCYVTPGYLAVSDEPTWLCSVCGNGVIVTVWDPIKKAGGMTHCIFPESRHGDKLSHYYADVAVPTLILQMMEINPQANMLEVQIFGGGNLRGFYRKRAEQVIKVIRKLLKKFGIPIVSEDLGGILGRKVVFNTYSGEAFILKTKKVRSSDWAPDYNLME